MVYTNDAHLNGTSSFIVLLFKQGFDSDLFMRPGQNSAVVVCDSQYCATVSFKSNPCSEAGK